MGVVGARRRNNQSDLRDGVGEVSEWGQKMSVVGVVVGEPLVGNLAELKEGRGDGSASRLIETGYAVALRKKGGGGRFRSVCGYRRALTSCW